MAETIILSIIVSVIALLFVRDSFKQENPADQRGSIRVAVYLFGAVIVGLIAAIIQGVR